MAGSIPAQNGDLDVRAAFSVEGLCNRIKRESGGVVGRGKMGKPDSARAAVTRNLGDEAGSLRVPKVAALPRHSPLEGRVVWASPQLLQIVVRFQHKQVCSL